MRRPRATATAANGTTAVPTSTTTTAAALDPAVRPPRVLKRGRCGTRRHVLASFAAGSLLLSKCAVGFHAHVPPASGTRGGTRNAPPTTRATRLPYQASTGTTVVEGDQVDTSAVLDDLARVDVEGWEGHEYGFDWYLEKARRGMISSNSGFAPLRMNFWRPTEAAEKLTLWDMIYIILRNLGQMVGLPSVDNAPVAKIDKYTGSWLTFLQKVSNGRLEDLAGGPLFLMLEKYFLAEGPVYKLAFGPRSFIVVSDPVMAKHVLKSSVGDYDKGVLATILEPIMGKGLIPADPETWKVRRRAIVPGFHKAWLNRMMRLFAECADTLVVEAEAAARTGQVLDMEEKFCSLSLDIIGRAVFNYEFDSVSKESPVIKAVYRVLREAEHRSSSFIPYWKLPFANKWIASQVEFARDMGLLNTVLDKLIQKALDTQEMADIEELERRDLDEVEDPSLLRFLIDMRGEDTTSKQLRDDLMTMLIAGHETTAAMLTWTLFNLVQNPEYLAKVHAEIDECMGPDGSHMPTFDDLPGLLYTRLALVEALRLYPEPPVIIRRALKETELPQGGADGPVKLVKGTDVFISTWNLHRSKELWDRPAEYMPERFLSEFHNKGVVGWKGFTPRMGAGLYPSEIDADFAFLPFGGGTRKCVGDQFAMMEATVTLAMMLKKLDFTMVGTPEDVGMVTGATIHTKNGLKMTASLREPSSAGPAVNGHAAAANGHSSTGINGEGINGINGAKLDAAVAAAKAASKAATDAVGNAVPGDTTASVGEGKCPMHVATGSLGEGGLP
ncbi:unnamed protein product [Ectocarpus sp. CCAP 1310/34]|nr:unnamed protein product [Ectocarpus sp. CCAP 1310/34]